MWTVQTLKISQSFHSKLEYENKTEGHTKKWIHIDEIKYFPKIIILIDTYFYDDSILEFSLWKFVEALTLFHSLTHTHFDAFTLFHSNHELLLCTKHFFRIDYGNLILIVRS